MKNTKLIVKFFLIIALFTTSALADGHMGGGGLADDGHMGGGGRTCDPQAQNCVPTCNPQVQSCVGDDEPNDDEEGEDDLFFSYVREFLASLIG
jgi:hypothetical protein